MRLFYIDPHPVPDKIPEALQILQTVDALAASGVNITLLTPAPADEERNWEGILGRAPHPSLKIIYEPGWRRRVPVLKRSSRLFNAWALDKLKAHAAGAIYVRNLKLADALVGARLSVPVFFEAHELFSRTYADEHPAQAWRERRRLATLKAREGRVYGGVSGVLALTSLLLDDIRGAFGYAGPGVVAPDGVDLDLARLARPPAYPNSTPILLYLGSLHVWKGVETAIAALPGISGALLRIAGGPNSRVDELRNFACRLGVAERIEFLGPVHPRSRFEVISSADICLLPLGDFTIGQRHTSPLKLFEYLAMGKPVIAADAPAVREVVRHGESALLFRTGDTAALAAMANCLLRDDELRSRLARNGAELALRYSWRARAEIIRDFLKERQGDVDK